MLLHAPLMNVLLHVSVIPIHILFDNFKVKIHKLLYTPYCSIKISFCCIIVTLTVIVEI